MNGYPRVVVDPPKVSDVLAGKRKKQCPECLTRYLRGFGHGILSMLVPLCLLLLGYLDVVVEWLK